MKSPNSMINLLLTCFLALLQLTTSASIQPPKRFDFYERVYNLINKNRIIPNEVLYVLDVGAYQGEFSLELRNSGKFPNAQYLCVEANQDNALHLTEKRLPHVISLVGDRIGEEVVYFKPDPKLTGLQTGNSIYRESTYYFDDPVVEKHRTSTIDKILEDFGLGDDSFQIMKVDIQGSELKALRGARKLIERSKDLIIITEVSLLPYNGGDAPTFFDIMLEMEKMNFKMIEIIDYVESNLFEVGDPTQTVQMDVAWQHASKVMFDNTKWESRDYKIDIKH